MFRHELVEHHSQRLIGLAVVAVTGGVVPKSDFSKQPPSLAACSRRRQLSMLADGDAARAAFASSELVLD